MNFSCLVFTVAFISFLCNHACARHALFDFFGPPRNFVEQNGRNGKIIKKELNDINRRVNIMGSVLIIFADVWLNLLDIIFYVFCPSISFSNKICMISNNVNSIGSIKILCSRLAAFARSILEIIEVSQKKNQFSCVLFTSLCKQLNKH